MQTFQVITLKQVVDYIRKYKAFRASNLLAVKDNNKYIFISHATVIAKADYLDGFYKIYYFDNKKYSNTTSKYQRLILQAFNVELEERKIYSGEYL